MPNNFVKCLCSTHLIEVSHDEDGMVVVNMWETASQKNRGRFYWMWESLKGNQYNVTEVIFDKKAVNDFIKALEGN